MSKSLRAQVSLIFSDEDLFDNFVTPLKENKELSGMIVKLLYVYYNNEDVRNMIEGISFDDLEGSEQVLDSTEAINKMRQTLAMQDYLFEQAKQTLDDGASEMDALMKVNDIAKQSGVVKTESTDVGEALVQISLDKSISGVQSEQENKTSNNNELEGRVNKIEEMLGSIMSMLQSGQFNQSSTPTSTEPIVKETEDVKETPILNEDSQVLTPQEDLSENLASEETVEEDASSELGDVLQDLLGL